jgi:putative DNA primase/helicase
VHSNIEKLTTRPFYLPALIGKKLNISNEEESKFLKSDTFKALITGNDVSAERKYGDPFDFKPNIKFIFASNKIPTFSDLNYGITRRIKIIPFYNRFDRENPQTDIFILDKLKSELPAIVKWAIAGAKRLVENKYNLSYSKQSDIALEEFQGDISSAVAFFREKYYINDREFTGNDDMYSEYRTWCEAVGKKPFSKSNFGRDLMNTFPDLKQKNGRIDTLLCHGKNCGKRNISEELEGVENANSDGVDITNLEFKL